MWEGLRMMSVNAISMAWVSSNLQTLRRFGNITLQNTSGMEYSRYYLILQPSKEENWNVGDLRQCLVRRPHLVA